MKFFIFILFLSVIYSCNDMPDEEKIQENLNYYIIGMGQYKSGELNEAIKSFKEDYKRTKNTESLFKLAEISAITGDPHNAEDYLKKAYNQNPENPRAIFELAFLYKKMGRFNKSINLFSKLLDDKNYLDEAYYHIIDIYVYLFKIEKAEELFQAGIKKIKNPYKIDYVFVNYFYDENKEKFKKYYSDIIKNCKDKKTLNKLVDFFFVKENIDEAFKVLKKMEILFPNDAETLTTIGQILLRRENFEEASKYFKRVEKISPKNISNKVNLATSEIYNDNLDKAQKYLKDALKIKKDSIKSLLLIGFIYLLKNDLEKSYKILETIQETSLSIQVTSYRKYNQLIDMYFMYYDLKKNNKFPDKKKTLNFITGKSQRLLALKCDILNETGLYESVIKLKLPEKLTNDNLIKELIIANIFLKKEKEAYKLLEKLQDNKEVYKIWLDYHFKKQCKNLDKKYEKYKKNNIFIDIYTNCLIKERKFKLSKKIINDFMKNNKLSPKTKEYLKKKIIVINYNILQQQ